MEVRLCTGLKHSPSKKSMDSWTIQKPAPDVQFVGTERRGLIRKEEKGRSPLPTKYMPLIYRCSQVKPRIYFSSYGQLRLGYKRNSEQTG